MMSWNDFTESMWTEFTQSQWDVLAQGTAAWVVNRTRMPWLEFQPVMGVMGRN